MAAGQGALDRVRGGPLGSAGTRVAGLLAAARGEVALLLHTSSGRIGLPLVLLHAALAVFGGMLAPYPPSEFHFLDESTREINRFAGPAADFWLGTDQFGRDLLSRVMSGATSIIVMSVSGAALGIALGTVVGMSSGYKGGKTDQIVMRVMDALMSFPSLLLALLVLASAREIDMPVVSEAYEERLLIVITIGVVSMPTVSRVLRSVTLALKEMEFVQSARLRGEPALYIIFREILPNTGAVLSVEASVRLSYAILLASSLGFLGLGVQPPSPDWGRMISESRNFLAMAPIVAIVPAVAVASLVIGVNLVADGIREAHRLPSEQAPP